MCCSRAVSSSTCSPAATDPGKTRWPRRSRLNRGPAPPAEQARKDLARLEAQIARLDERLAALHEQMEAAASDYQRLAELQREIELISANRGDLERSWLEAAGIAG